MEQSKYNSSFSKALENKRLSCKSMDRETDGFMIFCTIRKQFNKTFSAAAYIIITPSNSNELTAWELYTFVYQASALQVITLQ